MPRFYCDLALQIDDEFKLPDAVHRHVQVLRLNAGDSITLFNGDGQEYQAEVISVGNKSSVVRINQQTLVSRESPIWLGLAQGISSGDRMDFTLQKAVELGVSEIQPLMTRRSIVKLPADRWAKKHEHWRQVVIAACEQCGRNTIPTVHDALSLTDWLAKVAMTENTPGFVLMPGGETRIQSYQKHAGAWLLAGPEGGLTDDEHQQALAKKWHSLTLGPRVLRTETAALAALATLQTLWGDF
ncbi:16S rRNA (uracil(1498)-N(3))-methyltransferase [Leeia sp. TBRC 13508]|uniref:Ribosomal RNA small subunit methyltransferase E n=1 Tax=Leeia speluncae TaxID=2884804 RepID=A0ABS8D3R4_9NEIS|nr:16S rRNA (uracil(1498)-N(3))-methyltransferase [Leeia speluncae]MCB6182830.1 16S rRNA (uracil(1498)-N(3))-methyltransferase [Leeia speluncae]